jgi:tetratricopeptide (TPR) repeat protein
LNVWHRLALVAVSVALALGSLSWICRHDPNINFLPAHGRAAWIVFPRPVHSASHQIANLDTTFGREFSVVTVPAKAELRVRAARRMDIIMNGNILPLPMIQPWKDETTIDVTSLLRTGANTLQVRVFNDNAPAALCLSLVGKGLDLQTDQSWRSSITGSAWRPAALASRARLPGPGNPIAGAEDLAFALRQNWPTELLLVAGAVALCAFGSRWMKRVLAGNKDLPIIPFVSVAGALWLGLFINNALLLPFAVGFDCDDHLKYIQYLQEHWRVPWPGEGYEMFQAPLFYALSATALAAGRLSISDDSGILLLRGLTTFLGVAQFIFVFLSVRLLFPRRPGLQLAGLLLAVFLPMQLYLAHYVTNETLAATLGSTALYLALRLARRARTSAFAYLLFGLVTGAALLAKASSWLIVPPLFLMLAAKLWMEHKLSWISVRHFSVAVAFLLLVCGWYYIRIWTHFGTPFLGNWDAASGFSWWQDPGYHVAADYGRFGRSLVAPFFSSLNGFADGIYSTFWGDGLAAGAAQLGYRTPWNNGLMACGYLWAIVPTVMIGCGAFVALWRFVRAPSLEYLLLLSAAAATALGVIFMTLKVACFGQVKAFYGLAAVIPICVFGSIGWEVMTRGRGRLRFFLAVLLIVFASNSFASVWIHHSPEQRMFAARRLRVSNRLDEALLEASKAVTSDPRSAEVRTLLSSILAEKGNPGEAMAEAKRTVELGPLHAGAHLRLGQALVSQGEIETALIEARRALELGPEDPAAYDLLLLCLSRSNRADEIASVARDALALSPFSALLHDTVGLAAARQSDYRNALVQFGYAMLLNPNWPEPRAKLQLVLSALSEDPGASEHLQELAPLARESPALLNDLAWLRATSPDPALRNGVEAVAMAERSCGLTKRKDASCLATLAASYAEMDRFTESMAAAQEALTLAQTSSDAGTVRRIENLLREFQAHHPYREKSVSR